MANLLKFSCSCGYRGDAWVASTRAGFGKSFWFPFSCSGCNAVKSINVLKIPICCPDCGTGRVSQFGVKLPDSPTGTLQKLLGMLNATCWLQSKQLKALRNYHVAMAYEANERVTYGILHQSYFCPKCTNNTLRFSLSALVD